MDILFSSCHCSTFVLTPTCAETSCIVDALFPLAGGVGRVSGVPSSPLFPSMVGVITLHQGNLASCNAARLFLQASEEPVCWGAPSAQSVPACIGGASKSTCLLQYTEKRVAGIGVCVGKSHGATPCRVTPGGIAPPSTLGKPLP